MTKISNKNLPDTFLRGAILLLIFWIPLPLGSNRDWSSSLFILLIGFLASIWAVVQLQRSRAKTFAAGLLTSGGLTANGHAFDALSPHQHKPQGSLTLLTLLVSAQIWVAIQWAMGLSADSSETFRQLWLGIAYCLLFWLVISLFRSRDSLMLLLAVLVASGTFQAFFGAFMTLSGSERLLFGPKEHYRGLVTGTFVNRNHLAGYLEMTLACGIGLMLALRNGSSFTWRNLLETLLSAKIILRLTLAVMVIGLVMSQSRMGNVAFFSSLLCIGSVFVLTRKQHRLRNILIIASLLVIDMLIISQYFGFEKLMERLVTTRVEAVIVDGKEILPRNEGRLELFSYAVEQFSDRPLEGFGAGSFTASFAKYQGQGIRGNFDHAHNDYLEFAVEYGLIGMIPLALFVVLALYYALRAVWNLESTYHRGMGFAASMGILALMIHSSADFNLQIPANAATFIVLCAIAVLASPGSANRNNSRITRGTAAPSVPAAINPQWLAPTQRRQNSLPYPYS